MKLSLQSAGISGAGKLALTFSKSHRTRFSVIASIATFFSIAALFLIAGAAKAQVNVLTAHNDIARDGQNLKETILTPANVNATQFGKLFTQPVNGFMFAQPLYVAKVAIPGQGTHNVVYVATSDDLVYAFDADSNGGADAKPLWKISLLTNSTPSGTLTNLSGVWGTPTIDPSTNTMYLVSSENMGSAAIFRFHALDITTGAEKFGGPLQVQATIAGTGADSSGGVLTFDPTYHKQRPGLLFLNGVVYAAFGSNNDEGPWHGWIFSYDVNPKTNTLQQVDVFCLSPNGSGAGIWMGGSGLAAEVNNPAKPFGRMFLSVGNGSFENTAAPDSYGMTVLDLDLTGGVMTVEDMFSPYNEADLSSHDSDLGSGGPILLPTQTLASGKTLNPLVQIGKKGLFYILDRDNAADGSNNAATEYSPAGLGGFNATADQTVQEVQTPITHGIDWGAGVWGTTAYWNNSIYSGGTNVATGNNKGGTGTPLSAYSFVKGVMSTTPTSQSNELYVYPGPTPAISANGNTNGIVWALSAVPQSGGGTAMVVLAYDATNLTKTLYSSNTNLTRDNPGSAEKYTVPTIVNGKVYVGAANQLDVYGLLDLPVAPAPVITPASSTFTKPLTITMTDSIAGATIYYTTDGSTPSSSSLVYSSTNPPVITASETITAIASANGYLASPTAAETYVSTLVPADPVLSLAAATYVGSQTLTITDTSTSAVIHYTLDGSTPSKNSPVYSQPIPIDTSETVNAIAINPSGYSSNVVTAAYTVYPLGTINFTSGFTFAEGPMTFNGTTDLDDFRLQLTNGGNNEAGSAFYATPVNIQAFSNSFTFQLSNPAADGMTFTIQNVGATALGGYGGSLGYKGIKNSIAIKFDIYSNSGEGPNSTGLYVNGAQPTVPAINLTGTGIDLHSGDYINAVMTYDGTTLVLTLTDAITSATWSQSFTINIPATIGSNTAYVGFTAGTGGNTSSQKVTSWLYIPQPPPTGAANQLQPSLLTMNGGATFNATRLRLTDGNKNEARSAYMTTPVNVQAFVTNFDFLLTNVSADGFTFVVQGNAPTALGGTGGELGYQHIANSVAIKFDVYSNSGEGPDSTGLYTNGVSPTVPATNLTPTGINLHSGDPMHAQISYANGTLTTTITDEATNATATQSYTVNIPAMVGGNTAYVGFTGGSGGTTAIQEILDWSYTSTN